jgi:hypothetical protein
VLRELSSVPFDGVHGLEASGTVTSGDYEHVFAPLIDRISQGGQRLRLLYQFGPGFIRLTPAALWADSRLGVRYLPLLDGCALVTDVDWIREPGRSIAAWMPCPMRVYGNEHRDEAACWLASLHAGEEPSIAHMAKAYIGGTASAVASVAKLVFARQFRR